MKRYLTLAFALVAIGLALPALAEDKEVSLQFDKPTAVADIIKAVTEEEGLKVTGLEVLTDDMTFKGELVIRPVASVVSRLVKSYGFETVLDETTIHIRRKLVERPKSAAPVPVEGSRSAIQARVEELSRRYPQAYDSDGTIGSFAQARDLNRELYVQGESARQAASVYYPQYPQAESFFSSYGGYGYGGYLNPFAIRDFSNQEKYGLLKIDGPDRFLRNVRVLVDDQDVAVASKANNWWNSPIIVGAGSHTVEFVRESRDGILAFRRSVAIQPLAITGRNPARLRVSGNEFENARELYEYRQHRYVESPDGKLEPKPVEKK